MQVPLQIHFHNVDASPAVEAAIREHADKLEQFNEHIVSCRVTVECPHKHVHKGRIYHVTVDVRSPGKEVVVSRMPDAKHAHEDVYVAIRDAFKAARRRLQDHVRIRRGKVKSHETPAHGQVAALHPEDDYGLIRDPGGREIYFHRNSVINDDFDDLEVDAEVRFVEESGEMGPQASTVYRIGKHHIVG
jgi:ribosome-associated translation inhibitor RaiA